MWLDMHRSLAGDQAAAHRLHVASTVEGPCPRCGSNKPPGREQLEITTLSDPEPRYLDGLYECADCDFRTSRWPRIAPPGGTHG